MGLILHDEPMMRDYPVETSERYVLAADLGQLGDHTAIAVIRHMTVGTGEWTIDARSKVRREKSRHRAQLVFLQRLPLGIPYTAQVLTVAELLARHPLRGTTDLLFDVTGCGRAVVDLARDAGMKPVAVTITSGRAITQNAAELHLPKIELVGKAQAAIDSGVLEIAAKLPLLTPLIEELKDFRVELSAAGNMSFNARSGKHDDLVLAVSIALWWATRRFQERRSFKLAGF